MRLLLFGVAVLFWLPGTINSQVRLGDIRLSDPFILADAQTNTYYMTGTGGQLWKSADLEWWIGPYDVVQHDPDSWMGEDPMIWAAEIHAYKGRYYFFATFTNRDVVIDTVRGNAIERRACHVLVSDHPEGPYVPFGEETYLPAGMPTLDATLWIEEEVPYMLYCHEWLQNWNGTVEMVEMKADLSGTVGDAKVLFRAMDSPWSRERNEQGDEIPNKVTDGPWVFRTKTGKLGMLWTSWIHDVYTQGVAYSESGTLAGPWIQEQAPLTPPNFGHGMMFRSFSGELLMVLHSHREEEGRYIRHPRLFKVDDSGDKIGVVFFED